MTVVFGEDNPMCCWVCRSTTPGYPDGVDPAWQAKHYLGAPCPGGDEASVNLAHVVAAVEFIAVDMADLPSAKDCLYAH